MKKCCICKLEKPYTDFYKDRVTRDGYDFICKECNRLRYRDRRKDGVSYKKKDEKYYKNHRKEILLRRKIWYQKNKIKVTAHFKVQRALYKGLLIRKNCEICGSDKDINAHHEDYSKPLEVKWLCRTHHFRLHAEK